MVDPPTISAKQRRDQQAFATAAIAPPNLASREGIGWNDKRRRVIERRDCQRDHLYTNK
jgi:hypothetical protein